MKNENIDPQRLISEETVQLDKKRKKKGTFREYSEALLLAVLVALFIRSFGIEAFKIPSSSMVPTLVIGDHIFVNKFIYGLRIPLTKIRFFEYRKPERGEVIVFIYPQDEHKDFIKRVVGLPGDKVDVKGSDVFINGEIIKKQKLTVESDVADKRRLLVTGDPAFKTLPFVPGWQRTDYFVEKVGDANNIVQYEMGAFRQDSSYTVPDGHLFVMGDNRDNSSDSRDWGFVPYENVKGKAMFVWLSLDHDQGGLRWKRFGTWVE